MTSTLPKLVFATNNAHKLSEARAIADGYFDILSLDDIGCHDEIPETADSLDGNALIKARWIKSKYGFDCFADDTGLLVDALDGAPGVFSARYAGPQCVASDNMNLLLKNMADKTDRTARFVTAIALIKDGKEHIFHGSVEGKIAYEPHGTNGFGYDPIFVADESGLPFAEMSAKDKNKISHRGRAMRKLQEFLNL